MEPEGSLPHSQASATRPYPGLTQSSPHTHMSINYTETITINYTTLRKQCILYIMGSACV
jgi:hypothetical protein